MLFMRSVFGIGFLLIYLHKNVKKDTWDSLPKGKNFPLIWKILVSTATNVISYSCTKYVPLTVIAITSNMSPVICIGLAYLILKERLKRFQVFMIFLLIVGAFMVTLGGKPEKNEDD